MGARGWKQPGPTECTLFARSLPPGSLRPAPPPPSHFMLGMYCTTVLCTRNSTLHSGNYSTLVPTHKRRRMHDKDKNGPRGRTTATHRPPAGTHGYRRPGRRGCLGSESNASRPRDGGLMAPPRDATEPPEPGTAAAPAAAPPEPGAGGGARPNATKSLASPSF